MKKAVLLVILTLVAIGMIAPMLWMVLVSFRESPEQYATAVELIAAPATVQNYADAWSSDRFLLYFTNSLLVASLVTVGNVIFCLLAGYAFARNQRGMLGWLFASVLAVLVVPQQVVMIPMYRLIASLDWINTYAALIVPWLVTPFGVFLVRQYVLGLPNEVEDAARIDGASEWYIVRRIVAPLCKPVLTVLAIYTFLGNWNSFLYPFLFINDEAHRTLPVGLSFYLGKQSIDWGHLMAGASIAALPIILMFSIFQKKIIQGLTAGALKE